MKLKLSILLLFISSILSSQDALLRLNITPLSNKLYNVIIQCKISESILLADHNIVLYKNSSDSIISLYSNLYPKYYKGISYKINRRNNLDIVTISNYLKEYDSPPRAHTIKNEWFDLATLIIKTDNTDIESIFLANESTKQLAHTESVIMRHIGQHTLESIPILVSENIINLYNKTNINNSFLDIKIASPNPSRSLIKLNSRYSLIGLDHFNIPINENIDIIDISRLNEGLHILKIIDKKTRKTFFYKFIKV